MLVLVFVFFKQKTAYEMRISDWSSDVCSSDLNRLGLRASGARIGVRALPADGKALAGTKAAIAGQVHEPLDVHRNFAAKVALHGEVAVDQFADLEHFLIGQVLDATLCRDAKLVHDALGRCRANAVNISKGDLDRKSVV